MVRVVMVMVVLVVLVVVIVTVASQPRLHGLGDCLVIRTLWHHSVRSCGLLDRHSTHFTSWIRKVLDIFETFTSILNRNLDTQWNLIHFRIQWHEDVVV